STSARPARPALFIRWPLPGQPGWAAARRLAAARVFRHDFLVLAACQAAIMPAVLLIWTWRQPALFVHQHQVPAIMVLAVPLGLMILTGVFGHTSAAATGGLASVVLSVLGDRLLSHAWPDPGVGHPHGVRHRGQRPGRLTGQPAARPVERTPAGLLDAGRGGPRRRAGPPPGLLPLIQLIAKP
ncbi:MAG: hypothetical protein ACRDOB_28425, partial [Streptosporangiaceae bacterium]